MKYQIDLVREDEGDSGVGVLSRIPVVTCRDIFEYNIDLLSIQGFDHQEIKNAYGNLIDCLRGSTAHVLLQKNSDRTEQGSLSDSLRNGSECSIITSEDTKVFQIMNGTTLKTWLAEGVEYGAEYSPDLNIRPFNTRHSVTIRGLDLPSVEETARFVFASDVAYTDSRATLRQSKLSPRSPAANPWF